MDTDIISFETLIATRDSANWVMWGAIATGVAAIGSILTCFCAVAALSTWKIQEKTKIKSELKRSLLALDYAIHSMPDDWDRTKAHLVKIGPKSFISAGTSEAELAVIELKKCWHDALSAWVMCEGLLFKTNLLTLWQELSDIYINYLQGRVKKIVILNKLQEMHSVKFIFD
ncbi:hypothetical protein [Rahnella aceris]